ncbi:hypothetical protein EPO33_04260 [Patescibacteria group bacterium]|nr:MAG: hypothetical protein EPO33_04260 [Patescibacteria group bacterium]
MNMKKMLSAVAWVGAALLLAAFVANSNGYLSTNHPYYHIMNLLGAAGIAAQAWNRRAYPAAALNIVWAIVALIGLIRILG